MRSPAVTVSARPLRIALPTGIFPPDTGGPASYVPRVAAAFIARGHAVAVITLADDPASEGTFPFPVRRIRRGQARIPRMIATIRAIRSSAVNADLIFANGLFIEAAIAAALARKPLAMKVVGDWAWERAQNQGADCPTVEEFQARRQSPRWEIVKGLRTAVTRRATLVITPSRYLAGIVAAWGISGAKIRTIYNAVEGLPDAPPAALPSFAGRTLLTVARLVPWKGIGALIEWVSTRVDLRLLVIGDGPERSKLEALAGRCGAKARVFFTGNISRAQVSGYLKASDVFILNSSYEGLPHVVLEAFAAGVPVVATSAGGTAELVKNGDNGLLVPPGRIQELAEAVDRVLSDAALRASLAAGGRRALDDRFRWEALVAETEAALTALAPERKSPR